MWSEKIMTVLLAIEGLFIGTLLGLTGAGGGILAIPILMWSQDWNVTQAAPVALVAITISSGIATFQGLIEKTVRYKAAMWIAILSLPSIYLGIYLSKISPVHILTILLCIVMLFIGLRSIFSQNCSHHHKVLCPVNEETGRFIWCAKTRLSLGTIGIFSGFLTGLLGVGGGFVITPSLQKMTNLKFYSITNTSLMVIFLIGSSTVFLRITEGYKYPHAETIAFTITCIFGLMLGRLLCKYIPSHILKIIFSSTLIFVALILGYKTIGYIY
ncbi:sulfite exporter TauE/SafE family protein [Acinetobacter pollinis]|uniref:sulfite exporter TauE/SafE family protein n=1 Tax=Acinetobacter pollinis TaxID=2605270 RepID=UPI001D19223D|nr:sulfite exporter TauE/SafE family protein [Acinetobacter pollinis]